MPGDACEDCGSTDADHWLGDALLCDRCFDKRVARLTGYPELPGAPPSITLTDAEGRRHKLRFRVWRVPTGIEVELEELGVVPGEGYRRAVLGDHDADVEELVAVLVPKAELDMAQRFLEPNPHRAGYVLAGDKDVVEGRLVWSNEAGEVGRPYDVVVDGKKLTWEDLGRALEGYEGWRFRIELADRIDDLRSTPTVPPTDPPRTALHVVRPSGSETGPRRPA